MKRCWIVCCVTLWSLAGCSSEAATLIVQVRTDLGPGLEFDEAVTTLIGPDGAPRDLTFGASDAVDWGVGVRVAEWSDLAAGDYRLNVALRGDVALARPARVQLGSGDVRVVTVLITRDCAGVMCPAPAGDPSALSCLAGRCVPEECSEESPELCPDPECGPGLPTCEDTTSSCATVVCTPSGVCFAQPDHEMCEPGICLPEEGCRTIGLDAGGPEAGVVDAGVGTGRWEELDGSGSGTGIWPLASPGGQPSVAIDELGLPTVAWVQGGQILLVHFDGVQWDEQARSAQLAGISDTTTSSTDPSIAFDMLGRPVVAWRDRPDIYVRRLEGGAWVEMGAGSASPGGIGNGEQPALAVDSRGRAVVAWRYGSSQQIFVRRFEGTTWVELDGSATGAGISRTPLSSSRPAIAIDRMDRILVTWEQETPTGTQVYLRRWEGASWEELGGSASLEGLSNEAGASAAPVIAITSDEAPTVAWEQVVGVTREIYSRTFSSGRWGGQGGSGTMGGLSNTGPDSYAPALVSRRSGLSLAVAWHDNSGTNSEIYVRALDASFWVELGGGSASDRGISGTTADSTEVALASHPSRTCATWVEGTGILLRCYSEPP